MKQNVITTTAEAENLVKDCNATFDKIRAAGDPCDGKCTLEDGKTIHLVSTLNGIRKIDVRYTLPIDVDDFNFDFLDASA